jgi:predicted permease
MRGFLHDLRYAFRQLRGAPGFAVLVICTLGIGIGVNVALFSIVDGMILRPLPVRNPQRLVSFSYLQKGEWNNGFSYPAFEEIQKQTEDSLTGTAGFSLNQGGIAADGKVTRSLENYVTCNFFPVLGIAPALGRFIEPSDCGRGGEPVAVLGYSFWKTRLGGDPDVIGRTADVNGHPVTIIGVAPRGFHGMIGMLDTAAYLPLGMGVTDGSLSPGALSDPASADLLVFAWTKPGVSSARQRAAMEIVSTRLMREFPAVYKDIHLHADPLGPVGPSSGGEGQFFSVVAVFLTLTSLILILACVNVANLVLVRAAARQREMAVRSALGAGRGRLVRQLFTETFLLGLLGCGAGMGLGSLALRALPLLRLGSDLPISLDVAFDWRVYVYAMAVAVGTSLLVGVFPALRVRRVHLNQALQDGGRTVTEHGQRVRTLLSIAQVAGSLVLLIVAGLFVRSFQEVLRTNLGFNPDHVLNLSFNAHDTGFSEAQGRAFQAQLLARVRSLPGVRSASLAATVPMGYEADGADVTLNGSQPHRDVGRNSVSTGYFRTLEIPLLRGRALEDSDTQNSPAVAVINQTMATAFWPGKDAIGSTFSMDSGKTPIQVVGIVRDSHTRHFTGSPGPYFYLPITQNYVSAATVQVRTATAPGALTREIVQAIRALAPQLPVTNIQTMEQATATLNGSLSFQIGAVLAASLGALGLMLALIGLYGVISFAVARRTAEIGLRIALGADRRSIVLLVLKQGILIVAAGIALGSVGAILLGRLVRGLLYGVSATDPVTYLGISFLLGAVALAACFLPARRAARLDPMEALRTN